MRKSLLFLSVALLFAAAAFAADLPRYWAVHIDTPYTDAIDTFESLGKQGTAMRYDIFRKHDVPIPAVWELSTADGVYFTFRPREAVIDFDHPLKQSDEIEKEIVSAVGAIDDRFHTTIRIHHNELWKLDPELTFLPARSAPRFLRMRSETVKVTKWTEHDAAVKRVRAACEKAGVSMMTFFSSYGTGECHYLFLSEKPIDLRAIAGDAVLADWAASVITSREIEAKPRQDLTVTDAKNWIP
jgi:hypothetical protein